MDWERKLKPYQTTFEHQPLNVADVITWLLQQQSDGDLLAHADDGVIWGRLRDHTLVMSADVIPDQYKDVCPPLRLETLQQARLFSADWEILIWRAGDKWQCRIIEDAPGTGTEAFDEQQLLWGDYSIPMEGHRDFTLLEDGQQGLRHAVPIAVQLIKDEKRRVAIRVRHYLGEDKKTGVNHIAYSRLVNIEVKDHE